MSLLHLMELYEEKHDRERVNLRRHDARSYLATLVTTDQSEECVLADRQKMQVGLKNLDTWLESHPVVVNSVMARLGKSVWWSNVLTEIAEHLENFGVDTTFQQWLDNWRIVFSSEWNDHDSEKFPDMNNYWERCECVFKLILMRLSVNSSLESAVDKIVQTFEQDVQSDESADDPPIKQFINSLGNFSEQLMK